MNFKIYMKTNMYFFSTTSKGSFQKAVGTFLSLIIITLFLGLFFGIAFAQENAADYTKPGIIKCEGALTADEFGKKDKCGFAELIESVKYIINWLIIIAVPIVTLVFAYAGFLFMTGKESNISKAKTMLPKVVWGFVAMLGAWLLVTTILKFLVRDDSYLFFFK